MGVRLGLIHHDLLIGATAITMPLLKVLNKAVSQVCRLSVYNSHASNTLSFYIGVKHNGKIHRYEYKADLAAADVYSYTTGFYLDFNDELVIIPVGSAAGTTFEVSFELLDTERKWEPIEPGK